ncbi:translation initiation factor IF-2-like isoform X2 [Triticum dicoccoides]|uniref:translation initiation factor IF-2-like isoform X2 n=1 Tax=Triticum dicoccoides TaxID=85692 RepID=UPI0018912BF1|nr:translation initiation factor IF-2-like isoform X2 [Triticum dicoccoides]
MSSSDVSAIPAANHEEHSLAAPAAAVAQGKGKMLAQQAHVPVVHKRKPGRPQEKSPPPAATREELESRESREGPLKVLALPAPGAPRAYAVSDDKMVSRARAPTRRACAVSDDKMMDRNEIAPVVRRRKPGRPQKKSPPPAATREELESRESREGPLKVLALPAPGAPRTHAVSGDKMMRRARAPTRHANAVSDDKMVSCARAPTLHANRASDDKMMDKNEMAPVQGVPRMRGSIASSSAVGQTPRASVPPRREPWELEPGWV